ncbi:hypothetical protein [Parasitella parasitica]|uniref:Uncharacterized protein n=1 Tax=Parasitella parasitica TaxID=35722 RepID=A0A0B7N7Q9_9FUNG|nr:hypothetical protein [Parasitella parasitica]
MQQKERTRKGGEADYSDINISAVPGTAEKSPLEKNDESREEQLSEDDVEVLCVVEDDLMPEVNAKEVMPSPDGALASKFAPVTLQSRMQVDTANEMQALSDVRNASKTLTCMSCQIKSLATRSFVCPGNVLLS